MKRIVMSIVFVLLVNAKQMTILIMRCMICLFLLVFSGYSFAETAMSKKDIFEMRDKCQKIAEKFVDKALIHSDFVFNNFTSNFYPQSSRCFVKVVENNTKTNRWHTYLYDAIRGDMLASIDEKSENGGMIVDEYYNGDRTTHSNEEVRKYMNERMNPDSIN
jgi:hypothetical protein